MEKPKINIVSTVDFIDARNWLIENKKITIEQSNKAWDWVCNYLCVNNDSSYANPFPLYDEATKDPDIMLFSKVFTEEFPNVDQIRVSW